jgi:hypothetical protein
MTQVSKKKELLSKEEKATIEKRSIEKKKSRLLYPKFFLTRWLLKRKLKKYPHKMVLINMEHLSGHHSTFFIKEADGGFNLKGRTYQLDAEQKYYNVDFGYYMYDYHELFSLPISRVIPINAIKATVEQDPSVEIEYMVNPTTLKRFVVSKIAEGIMQGQDLPKAIRRIFMIVGINLIITILMLLVVLYMSGIFGEVRSII